MSDREWWELWQTQEHVTHLMTAANSAEKQRGVMSPIGKDSAAGRDWGQEEKGTTEDEMAGWHP